MQSFFLSYTATDGARSGITVFPSGDTGAPVVLVLPAMGAEAIFYRPFAEQLARQGFHGITADWRGKGLSSLRASRSVDFGFREIWHYDFPALFDRVRAQFPQNPIIVYGHSLGGQLAGLYLASHPETNVQGLVLHTACHVYYRNWGEHARKAWWAFYLFPLIARVWGYFPGHMFGFARREARTTMRDWGYAGRRGLYHAKGLLTDYDALGECLTLPILAVSLEDDWLAPRKGLEHLYALFPNAPVRHLHFDATVPEEKPLSHFNWVYRAEVFVKELKEWFSNNATGAGLPEKESTGRTNLLFAYVSN
ncbi:MAG: alpha/beta fold hydrolase [Haliscomenobacteraceae bacterium CHB4]|nr:alpha/beta fold hydrolase [Haliscomenobacteraceae bacterium CHB4]